jgi:biopolymer transport protein ExbD
MARAAAPVPEESVSPNIVPLLDVMFLLLIFLMIGSDMSVRETADVALAVASEAKEPPHAQGGRFATLNVVHRDVACDAHTQGFPCRDTAHWAYAMRGSEIGDGDLAARLALVGEDALEPAGDSDRRLSAVTLSIRCDRNAPYGRVQDALLACSTAGIHRTEVAAARPAGN